MVAPAGFADLFGVGRHPFARGEHSRFMPLLDKLVAMNTTIFGGFGLSLLPTHALPNEVLRSGTMRAGYEKITLVGVCKFLCNCAFAVDRGRGYYENLTTRKGTRPGFRKVDRVTLAVNVKGVRVHLVEHNVLGL